MTRVLSGATLAALAAGGIWFLPPAAMMLPAGCVLLLAFAEYAGLARSAGLAFDRVSSASATLAAAAAVALAPGALAVVAMAGLLPIAAAALVRPRGGGGLAAVGAAVFPLLWLGLPVGALAALHLHAGREALLLLIATIAASDTAQYYGGRLLGRRPLAPAVSPGKTVEGALCGAAAGAAAFAGAGAWWLPAAPPPARAVLGMTLAVLGMAGDLFESHLKRASGVKDSSDLIPGHGGVLDRIDGLLFAAPVHYAVLFFARGGLP